MANETSSNYDRTTIALHWITAALVALLWVIGQTGDLLPKGPLRADYWSVHVVLGFALAAVLIARIVWRNAGGRRLPPADAGIRQTVAKAVHYTLYALLLLTIAGGVANALVRGFNLFGFVSLPQLGDKALKEPLTEWHGLAANLVFGLALIHSAIALAHHYVLKDTVFGRMLPDQRPVRNAKQNV
jgi:cytochrome b561